MFSAKPVIYIKHIRVKKIKNEIILSSQDETEIFAETDFKEKIMKNLAKVREKLLKAKMLPLFENMPLENIFSFSVFFHESRIFLYRK